MINPIFHIGPLSIHWYGVILATAVLAGYFLARKNSWKFGISVADIDDFSFWLVIVGILGARTYYVLFNFNYYAAHISEVYKIWNGGLSIYGAVLTGIIFTYFYSRSKAYSFGQLADLLALSLPLAQALGRFGNFVNQEAYGTVTKLPWGIYIQADNLYHHPTFLYEAIADVIVFLILWKISTRGKPGNLALVYLLTYSLFRFFIEAVRTDSQFLAGFRVDQITALLLIVASGIILLKRHRRNVQ